MTLEKQKQVVYTVVSVYPFENCLMLLLYNKREIFADILKLLKN